LIPKTVQGTTGSRFTEWFSGSTALFQEVPINGYWFKEESSIVIRHYIDDGIEDTLTDSLASLLPDWGNTTTGRAQLYLVRNRIITRTFYLGTDRFSRDILSRLIVGSRVTLSVGLIAVLLSLTIGIFLGAIGGYYGGIADNIIMWFINIIYAIPTLLLVFAITLAIGKGFWEIFIAIGLSMWVGAARLVRGQVLALREMDYITAAKAIGLGNMRQSSSGIYYPTLQDLLWCSLPATLQRQYLLKRGLVFLGFGVQPPNPSWGLMIKEHYNFLLTNRPMLALIPGIAIMLLVYSFNILGNALRDVLDVREK
jgi:peptide/nickel transport system permease protein